MEDTEIFTLVPTKQYDKCRNLLDKHNLKSLDDTLTCLEINPYDMDLPPLRGSSKGKNAVRFANGSYRLIMQINWNDKKIALCHLAPRSRVYIKMW